MGTRANIYIPHSSISIYLHWNGGRDSIEGFLAYAKYLNYNTPIPQGLRLEATDLEGLHTNATAKLYSIIENFLEDSTRIYKRNRHTIDPDYLEDNGTYIVDPTDWTITQRIWPSGHSQTEQHQWLLPDMLRSISDYQPAHKQIPHNVSFDGTFTTTENLQEGDQIILPPCYKHNTTPTLATVNTIKHHPNGRTDYIVTTSEETFTTYLSNTYLLLAQPADN